MNNDVIAQIGWQHSFEGDSVLQFGYIKGFKEGADVMLENALQHGTQDLLVFPIVFCYRQYIELVLKNILRQSFDKNKYLEIVKCCRHNLVNLLQYVKHTQLYNEKINDSYGIMDKIVTYLNALDTRADSYRFPYNFNGYSINKGISINLSQLQTTMNMFDETVFQTYN